MSTSFILILLILALVATNLYFIIQAEGGINQWPRLADRVGLSPERIKLIFQKVTASPAPTPTPGPLASGNSRFSQGTCLIDSECFISGCSSEICGNQKAISTCEYSYDFPGPDSHTCSCLAGKCGWTAK